MNHYIKARTNGINCYGSSQSLQILQEMFPLHSVDDDDIEQALQKHFNNKDPQHIRFLQQMCFKTPVADVAKVYDNFRKTKYPQIVQPRISDYFDNDSFVSLRAVEKWLDGEGKYPSLAQADTIKQQITESLLSISQQFGYIPNLQRFLLYYPSYLIKVLKFKNRFFQQKIEQTCQVTYLSPKNCCFAGIIAAVQIGCPYMIARMINMFLVRDGNISWLKQKKYPQQFKPLFGLFRKIAVAPWSINQNDLIFSNTNWDKQVYFDYITAGMFVISMSTICLALGLKPDQPCKFIPLQQILQIKRKYDQEQHINLVNKKQLIQQIRQMMNTNVQRQFSKLQVQEIQGKLVQPYMKQIGMRLATQDLYVAFNKFFDFFGMPAYQPINLKAKNNSFFHRYRDTIEKGLEQQRKSDKLQDQKFQCFKSYCVQGSNMTFNNFGKKSQQNTRVFRKLIQVMTYNLCGYHYQSFDYKKYVQNNLTVDKTKHGFINAIKILRSPLIYLCIINHEKGAGWIQCFDLGHLAIMVAQNKAKLLMSSIQIQLFK